MKRRFYHSIAMGAALILTAFVIAAQEPEQRYKELPNFHRVNEHLYRGGQPKDGGIKKLAELGVKTIVNLRGESDDTRVEETEAKNLGLQYLNIPMSSAGRPTDEQIKQIFEIIDSPEKPPVFIHCRRGADRTGVIVAIYRIKRDGWTAEQAIDEAKHYGMGLIQFQKRGFIKDFYEQQHRERK
jgi:uncharacterized protein (TIGR01244 family)